MIIVPLYNMCRYIVPSYSMSRYIVSLCYMCDSVHFGYSGHLGPPIGHYIRPEYDRIDVFGTRKSGHYI